MTKINLSLLAEGKNSVLYTIAFKDEESEYQKFAKKCLANADFQEEYYIIVDVLTRILYNGALERYFRHEGKMSDRVVALPIEKTQMRLYCLRISDKILILGNGGQKKTKTYQENAELAGYVLTLQKFDEILRSYEKSENVRISELTSEELNKLEFDYDG